MIIFHWEYVVFPLILLSMVALILGAILLADMRAEKGRKKTLKEIFTLIKSRRG